MDDADSVEGALQSLVVVTANSDVTCSATLPFKQSASLGVRTTNTKAFYGAIPGIMAGMTTAISEFFAGR